MLRMFISLIDIVRGWGLTKSNWPTKMIQWQVIQG